MKKLLKYLFLMCMMFSVVACSSKNDEESVDEEKITEKEDKKDSKENDKKKTTKEENKQTNKQVQIQTNDQSEQPSVDYQEEVAPETYEVYEPETEQPVENEETQKPLEDEGNYVYTPEEDKTFSSYDEALAYGRDHAMEMHDKYGKAVRYGTSKNDGGDIVLSWYVKE